jgi:hypothetical protein
MRRVDFLSMLPYGEAGHEQKGFKSRPALHAFAVSASDRALGLADLPVAHCAHHQDARGSSPWINGPRNRFFLNGRDQ